MRKGLPRHRPAQGGRRTAGLARTHFKWPLVARQGVRDANGLQQFAHSGCPDGGHICAFNGGDGPHDAQHGQDQIAVPQVLGVFRRAGQVHKALHYLLVDQGPRLVLAELRDGVHQRKELPRRRQRAFRSTRNEGR